MVKFRGPGSGVLLRPKNLDAFNFQELHAQATKEVKKAIIEMYTEAILCPTMSGIIFNEDTPKGESADVTCSKFYQKKFEEASKLREDSPFNLTFKIHYWTLGKDVYLRPIIGWGFSKVLWFLDESNDYQKYAYVKGLRDKSVSVDEWARRGRTFEKLNNSKYTTHGVMTVLEPSNYFDVDPTWSTGDQVISPQK